LGRGKIRRILGQLIRGEGGSGRNVEFLGMWGETKEDMGGRGGKKIANFAGGRALKGPPEKGLYGSAEIGGERLDSIPRGTVLWKMVLQFLWGRGRRSTGSLPRWRAKRGGHGMIRQQHPRRGVIPEKRGKKEAVSLLSIND